MKLNKEELMNSEFGQNLSEVVRTIDCYMSQLCKYGSDDERHIMLNDMLNDLHRQLEIYALAIKHFSGIDYRFTRSANHIGMYSKEQDDFLFKVDR